MQSETRPSAAQGHPAPPLRVRVLDIGVVLFGLLIVVVAIARAGRGTPLDAGWPGISELLLAVPLTTYLSQQSLRLARSGGAVHVALDSAVLVLLAWTVPSTLALLAWLAGVALAELLAGGRAWVARAFNVALSAIAGSLLLAAVVALRTVAGAFGIRDLLALLVASVGYLAVDLVLTGLSVSWAERARLRDTLADESVPLAIAAVFAVNGVGLLAALLSVDSAWAVVLLVPVLLSAVYAARASATANTERLRTATLFDAAARTQAADSRAELDRAVTEAAGRLTASAQARLHGQPPEGDQLGAQVRLDPEPLWLVVDSRPAGNAFTSADASALQVLAALAGQALDRLELLQSMSRAANSDALTGLANRREVEQALARAVAEVDAGPDPAGTGPGLVYLDLDGFKLVNDLHGHAVGDELLVAISKRLTASVREQDLVARWGGDEFVVLLHETDEDHARSTAERLRAAVAGDVALGGPNGVVLRIEASAGVALHRPGGTPRSLLAAADAAMYAVKHAGRH